MKNEIKHVLSLFFILLVLFPIAAQTFVDFNFEEKPIEEGYYNVYHLQQKVEGGNNFKDYNRVANNSLCITSETSMESLKREYEGFTYRTMVAKGNILYIFYDRNAISYTFQTGKKGTFLDGTTKKVLNGLYGAKVPEIPETKSDSYFLRSWDNKENIKISETFGNKNLVFTGKWNVSNSWYETPVDVKTGKAATAASEYVYFGVFPQTVLPENSSVKIDETKTIKRGKYTYYKGSDNNWYAKFEPKLWYEELENELEEELKDYEVDYEVEYEVEYEVFFEDEDIKETFVYYRVEPIKWKVFTTNYNNTGKALLVAENIISYCMFCYEHEYYKRGYGKEKIIHDDYKYSQIRAYLNGKYEEDDTEKRKFEGEGVLQTAFTAKAQNLISTTNVDGLNDKIFLLSSKEAEEYNENNKINLIRKNTDYSIKRLLLNSAEVDYWYLRDIETKEIYWTSVYAVNKDGYIDCVDTDNTKGVVPALCISLQ